MSEERQRAARVTRRAALRAAGGAVTVSGAGLAGASIGAGASPAAASIPGHEVVGSWINARTANGGVVIASFTADGGWSNVHPNRRRSPAQGTWVRAGERTFHVTRWSLRFDDRDRLIGTLKTRAETVVDPDGNGLSSVRISESFDLAGNLVSATPLVASRATRIRAEPPR